MQRPETDQELMLRIREDDAGAFEELMTRYQDRITGFFFNLSRDTGLAEDLFQETFIRVWRARKRYQPIAKFSTYLIAIARHLWLDERSRWLRRRELASLDDVENDRPSATALANAELRELPEEYVLRSERQRQIENAIDALPPSLSIVFILSQYEGYKYREIAGMLNIAEGTVKWRMSEAVRLLRGMLGECMKP